MLKGLSHVAIAVTDPDQALEFYLKIPGIKEHFRLFRDDGTLGLIYLKVGPNEQFIELLPRAVGKHEMAHTAGYRHVSLWVEDMDALYNAVIANGLTVGVPPKMGGDGAIQMWMDDPDGNPIEFHQLLPDSLQMRGSGE
jgi:lactoylglutathione lyase